jgi:signal transduction histidine kinase
MKFCLRWFWDSLSCTGVSYATTEREKKEVILINRSWFILVLIQVGCLVAHIVRGLERSALLTAGFIAALFAVRIFLHYGRINAAKIAAIAVININTVIMAVFMGIHTNLIDFLLLTALLPFYFFEVKQTRLMLWGAGICIVPFALYHYVAPHLAQYAMPLDAQQEMFKSTNWVKVFSLATLLYLIYNKNALYESEVQEKEAQLKGQKKLYECILEQIPVDIATFDKQLRYSFVNSAAVPDPEVRKWIIGKTNTDFVKEQRLDLKTAGHREQILREALDKETSVEFEESFIDRNNKVHHTLKGTSPIFSGNNEELLCLVAYSLDITAIKEAEQKLKEYAVELERKNEDMHHFVNATSHDLKTPLRNIISHLQILVRKNEAKLDKDSMSLISFVVKSVKHLNQLINDIYHYSVAERAEIPAEITELGGVLETILLDMEQLISQKAASIQFSHLPVIRAFPSHIGMIFSNLVGNALKYNNSAHPQIKIDCETTATEYVISVADNGIGIAPEYREQIFEIFRRLHTNEEYEGTGVGLAICSKIVENYGGKIWVESESGKGSVFYFSLNRSIVDPEIQGSHKILSYKKFAVAS